MRNIFSGILIAGLLVGAACNSLAQGGTRAANKLTLQGQVAGFPDSLWAAIIDPQKGNYIGSPTRILNRSFTIVTQLPAPTAYVLMIGNPQQQETLQYFNIFLANELVSVKINAGNAQPEVLEGAHALAFSALLQQLGPSFDKLSMLNKMRESAGTFHYSPDSIAAAREQVIDHLAQQIPDYLSKHYQTAVAPFLLNIVWPLNFPFSKMESWMKMIPPAAMQNDYGAALTELAEVEKLLGYGQLAPGFTQNDTEGKPVSLSSFKGRYVLIDFWASWCGPCRQENPNVVRAFEKYKAKNFTVLGVSLDRDRQKWVQAIAADQLHWTQVSDLGFWNNAAAKLYRVSSIPQNYLLDPEGRIIGKNLRGEELNAFLEKTLANN